MKNINPELSQLEQDDRRRASEKEPFIEKYIDDFDKYAALLRKWNKKINLISKSTEPEIYTRHFCESLSLLQVANYSKDWVDIGSGAGFPGLPIGIVQKHLGSGHTTLIECNSRKSAFLTDVSRETSVNTKVITGDYREIVPQLTSDIICARALAPPEQLLHELSHIKRKGQTILLLVGPNSPNKFPNYTCESILTNNGRGAILMLY